MMMKLSIDALTTIQNANKADSIRSYIKSQQQNASVYAAEGKIFQASWKDDLALPADSHCASPLKEESGFRTPTLKPRTLETTSPSVVNIEVLGDKTAGGDKEKSVQTGQKIAPDESIDERYVNRRVAGPNQVVPVTKRARAESVDKERDHRLAQRRARKRAKRDIMNPDRKTTEQKQQQVTSSTHHEMFFKPSKGGKGKKDKMKLPATLSLLYGFSASNIGQKRLTLKPGAGPGVFNKGKASATTKINKDKKSGKRVSAIKVFSEATFLNSTKRKAASDSSTGALSGISDNSAATTSSHKDLKFQSDTQDSSKRKKRSSICVSSDGDSHPAPVIYGSKAGPRGEANPLQRGDIGSEVWEIEKENGSLPSDTSTAVRPRAPASTVVLDTRDTAWGKNKISLNITPEVASPLQCNKSTLRRSDSASLCPSQSASQLPHKNSSLPQLVDIEQVDPNLFSHPALFMPTRHATVEETQDASSKTPGSGYDKNSKDSAAPQETITNCVEIPRFSSPGFAPHPQVCQEVDVPDPEQANYPICESVDSLEEKLRLCAADDYVLDVSLKSRANRRRNLNVAPVVSVYRQSDCDKKDYRDYDFALSDSYEDIDPETIFGIDVETTPAYMFDGEEELGSNDASAVLHPEHEYDDVIDFANEIPLPAHGLDFCDIRDVDPSLEDAFCNGDEEASSNYYDDHNGPGSESLMLSDGMDEEDDDIRLQHEVMSDWSEDSEADIQLSGQHFTQGRALLLGLSGPRRDVQRQEGCRTTTVAEEEVARNIKGHWLPQKL